MVGLTEQIAALPLPVVVLILAALTAVRLVARRRLSPRSVAARVVVSVSESTLLAVTLYFLLIQPFLLQSYHIPSASMRPTLVLGDRLFVNKWIYRTRPPRRGEVLVFRVPPTVAPDERPFIKRVVGLPGDVIEVRAGYVQIGRLAGGHFTGTIVRLSTDQIRAILGDTASVSERTDEERQHNRLPLRLTDDALWLGDQRIEPHQFLRLAHPNRNEPIHIVPAQLRRNGLPIAEDWIAEDMDYSLPPTVVPPGHLFVLGDNRNDSEDSHAWGALSQTRIIGRADCIFWPPTRLRSLTPDGE